MRFDDDMDADRDHRAVLDAERAALVDAAMRDILNHDFQSFAVLECQRIGLMRLASDMTDIGRRASSATDAPCPGTQTTAEHRRCAPIREVTAGKDRPPIFSRRP